MVDDLIFDVGAHLGHDTAYYLHRGFRVVAVEANPNSAKILHERFTTEIEAQRLVIVNKAVAPVGDKIELFVSKSDSGSCSILKDEVDDILEGIVVECCRFSDLLLEFGVPYYLKVDIQGVDKHCLESINSNDVPAYVSWELDRDQISCLQIVNNLGYKRYKFIDQTCFYDMQYSLSLSRKIKNKLKRTFSIDGDENNNSANWEFKPSHSSGPFGEDTHGKWRTFNEAYAEWINFSNKYPTRHQQPSWFDCHAGQ